MSLDEVQLWKCRRNFVWNQTHSSKANSPTLSQTVCPWWAEWACNPGNSPQSERSRFVWLPLFSGHSPEASKLVTVKCSLYQSPERVFIPAHPWHSVPSAPRTEPHVDALTNVAHHRHVLYLSMSLFICSSIVIFMNFVRFVQNFVYWQLCVLTICTTTHTHLKICTLWDLSLHLNSSIISQKQKQTQQAQILQTSFKYTLYLSNSGWPELIALVEIIQDTMVFSKNLGVSVWKEDTLSSRLSSPFVLPCMCCLYSYVSSA